MRPESGGHVVRIDSDPRISILWASLPTYDLVLGENHGPFGLIHSVVVISTSLSASRSDKIKEICCSMQEGEMGERGTGRNGGRDESEGPKSL